MTARLGDPWKWLRQAAAARRLLPFVGAGLSKNVDRGMPNWDELVDVAAELLDYSPTVIRAQGDAYQIADLLSVQGKLERFYEVARDRLDSPDFSVAMSKPHTLLPYIDADTIYTTNWDHWIERAFEAQGVPFRSVRTVSDLRETADVGVERPPGALYSDAELARLRQHRVTDIYKFHGDLDDEDSLVFRESDYFDRMRFEDPLDIRFRSEILEKSVLFMGYSYRDMDIRLIWHKLGRALERVEPRLRPTSFFVTYGDFPLQRDLFAQKKIEIISIDPLDKSGGLVTLFQEIIDAQH